MKFSTILAKDLKPGDIISLDFGMYGRFDDRLCKVLSVTEARGLFGESAIYVSAETFDNVKDLIQTSYVKHSTLQVYEK